MFGTRAEWRRNAGSMLFLEGELALAVEGDEAGVHCDFGPSSICRRMPEIDTAVKSTAFVIGAVRQPITAMRSQRTNNGASVNGR